MTKHNLILWGLVTIAFLDLARRLALYGLPRAPRQVSSIVAVALCLSAVGFKVAFTKADAPELLSDVPQYVLTPMVETPLVTHVRTIFLGITLSLVYGCFQRVYWTSQSRATRLGS